MDRIDEILFLYEDDTVEMADGGPITANKIPLKPANKNINKKGQPDTTRVEMDISPIPGFRRGGYLAGGLKKLGRKYKGSTLEALLENPKLVGSELGYEGLSEIINLLQGSGLYADGGIASLPGAKSGPPPESGPNPQGLENVKYYVTNT